MLSTLPDLQTKFYKRLIYGTKYHSNIAWNIPVEYLNWCYKLDT